jgi:hypothetical protein
VCGNSAGYVGFIENLDGGNPPKWNEPKYIAADGQPIRVQAGPNGSIQGPCEAKWGYTTFSVADWNQDGKLDIVLNSIWGKAVWYENAGTASAPRLKAAQPVVVDWPSGTAPPKPAWVWWEPGAGELAPEWRTTPAVIDLDKDGLNDLVMLDHEGYLAFFRRARKEGQLVLQPGERVFQDAKGELLRLNVKPAGGSGRRKFCFTDWDGDGKTDILIDGRNINFLRNVSTDDAVWKFQDVGPMTDRRLAGHDTSPTPVDWDRDGRPDLLIGAEDGRFYLVRRPER